MRSPIVMLATLLAGLAGCSQGNPTAPGETGGALFEASRETHRGFERVREIERRDSVSVIRVETNFYGGALGSASYGRECLNELCKTRGFTHWVILRHEVARSGDLEAPGNDWSVTIGLLRSPAESDAVPTLFPDLAVPKRAYQVFAANAEPSERKPQAIARSSDLWDVFSSIHFRYTK